MSRIMCSAMHQSCGKVRPAKNQIPEEEKHKKKSASAAAQETGELVNYLCQHFLPRQRLSIKKVNPKTLKSKPKNITCPSNNKVA